MFTFNSILTRPNNTVLWFRDAHPVEFNQLKSALQASPGFISGIWDQDPNDPNKFTVTHLWVDQSSWQQASSSLKLLDSYQANQEYRNTHGMTIQLSFDSE